MHKLCFFLVLAAVQLTWAQYSFNTVKNAVIRGNKGKLEEFVSNGADTQMIGPVCNRSLLTWAVLSNQPETMRFLLENGADANIRDRGTRETPLHHAIHRNNRKMIKILMEHNADRNVEDINGKTPLQMALDKGINLDEEVEAV